MLLPLLPRSPRGIRGGTLLPIFFFQGSYVQNVVEFVKGVGGFMYKLGRCLPFLYATKLARSAISMDFGVSEFLVPLGVVVFSAIALTILASIVFNSRMRADQR